MLRILYVEDNAANLSLVHRVARVGGHEVVNRTSGEAALNDFGKIRPDLVLMDIQLEGTLTGLDVVQQLRASGYTVPIIAVTAYAMKGDREKAINAGCDDYLPKPLPIKELVALIQRFENRNNKLKTDTARKTTPLEAVVVAPEQPVTAPKSVAPPAETETVDTTPEPAAETTNTVATTSETADVKPEPVTEESKESPVAVSETSDAASQPVALPTETETVNTAPESATSAPQPGAATPEQPNNKIGYETEPKAASVTAQAADEDSEPATETPDVNSSVSLKDQNVATKTAEKDEDTAEIVTNKEEQTRLGKI